MDRGLCSAVLGMCVPPASSCDNTPPEIMSLHFGEMGDFGKSLLFLPRQRRVSVIRLQRLVPGDSLNAGVSVWGSL